MMVDLFMAYFLTRSLLHGRLIWMWWVVQELDGSGTFLTLNIPSLARQRFYQAGVLGGPHGIFVISQLFDAVDY